MADKERRRRSEVEAVCRKIERNFNFYIIKRGSCWVMMRGGPGKELFRGWIKGSCLALVLVPPGQNRSRGTAATAVIGRLSIAPLRPIDCYFCAAWPLQRPLGAPTSSLKDPETTFLLWINQLSLSNYSLETWIAPLIHAVLMSLLANVIHMNTRKWYYNVSRNRRILVLSIKCLKNYHINRWWYNLKDLDWKTRLIDFWWNELSLKLFLVLIIFHVIVQANCWIVEFSKVGNHIFERNLSLTRVNVLGRWKENLLADLPVAAYYLYTPRPILTLDRSRFFDRVIINCSIPWTKDNGEIWPDTLQYLDWNCTVSQQR